MMGNGHHPTKKSLKHAGWMTITPWPVTISWWLDAIPIAWLPCLVGVSAPEGFVGEAWSNTVKAHEVHLHPWGYTLMRHRCNSTMYIYIYAWYNICIHMYVLGVYVYIYLLPVAYIMISYYIFPNCYRYQFFILQQKLVPKLQESSPGFQLSKIHGSESRTSSYTLEVPVTVWCDMVIPWDCGEQWNEKHRRNNMDATSHESWV